MSDDVMQKVAVLNAARELNWDIQDIGLCVKPFSGVSVDIGADDLEPNTGRITAPLCMIPDLMRFEETANEVERLRQHMEQLHVVLASVGRLVDGIRTELSQTADTHPIALIGHMSNARDMLGRIQDMIGTLSATTQQTTAPAMVTDKKGLLKAARDMAMKVAQTAVNGRTIDVDRVEAAVKVFADDVTRTTAPVMVTVEELTTAMIEAAHELCQTHPIGRFTVRDIETYASVVLKKLEAPHGS